MNWKVRFKNKAFWIAFIPAVLVLVQAVLACFGVSWDYTAVSQELLNVVAALFAVLAILGVVNDPTTAGFGDSKQAMTYDAPKPIEGDNDAEDKA